MLVFSEVVPVKLFAIYFRAFNVKTPGCVSSAVPNKGHGEFPSITLFRKLFQMFLLHPSTVAQRISAGGGGLGMQASKTQQFSSWQMQFQCNDIHNHVHVFNTVYVWSTGCALCSLVFRALKISFESKLDSCKSGWETNVF